VPADTAAALGGFLAARHAHVSALAVFVVTIVANVASATAMFYLARRLGPAFRASRLGRRLLPPRAVAAVQRELERHPRVGIFVSRCLPVYRAVVPPFAGMVGISAGRALPAIALASGLFYAGVVWLAYSLGSNWEAVRDAITHLGSALLGLAAALTLYVAWRIWKRRHDGGHDSPDRPAGVP